MLSEDKLFCLIMGNVIQLIHNKCRVKRVTPPAIQDLETVQIYKRAYLSYQKDGILSPAHLDDPYSVINYNALVEVQM